MFYFLRQNLFEAKDVIEVVGHNDVTGQFMWTAGIKFDKPIPKQTLLLNSAYGTTFADYFDTSIPLMSDRLVSALGEAGVNNFDAYPVTLRRLDTGQEFEGYSAVNFLGAVDAVDLGNSEYRLRFNKPYFTGRVTIDAAKSQGLHAFRLLKGPGFVVINERTAEILKRGSFVALLLQPTTNYSGT